MAFASVGTIGSVQSKTADQSTLVLTTSATVEAGNLIVLVIAVDNNQTTDGDERALTGVTDSAGNAWEKLGEFTNGQGTAQNGATCSVWMSRVRTQLTSGGTITAAFSNNTSRDASAATAWEFTVASNALVVQNRAPATLATDGGTTPGSLNLTTDNISCLRVRGLAYEGPIANHNSTITASWTAFTENGTTGGGAATNMTVWGEHRIQTATSSASNPGTASTGADWASVYAALMELPWFDFASAWSERQRLRKGLTAAALASGLIMTPVIPEAPAAPGDDAVKAVTIEQPVPYRRTVLYPSIQAPVAEIVTVDKWFQPLWSPAARWHKPTISRQSYSYSVPFAADAITSVDQWLQPFSLPLARWLKASTSRQAYLYASAFTEEAPQPQPGNNDVIASGFSQPVPYFRVTLYPSTAYAPYVEIVAEVVTVDKWHAALAEPMRRKPSVAGRPAVFFSYAVVVSAPDSWHRSFSDPVRAKRRTALYTDELFVTIKPEPGTDDTRPDQWWRAFSDPTRRSVRAQPPSLTYGYFVPPFAPGTDDTRPDQWWQRFSEPTRRKVRPQPPALGWSTFTPAPGYGWFRPWLDPVRRKFSVTAQPSNFWGYFAPAVITVDMWFRPLDAPVRKPNLRRQGPALAYSYQQPVAGFATWFVPFSEPVRLRLLDPALQPAYYSTQYVAVGGPDDAQLDEWWQPLQVPMRLKVRPQPDAFSYGSYTEFVPEVPPRTDRGQRINKLDAEGRRPAADTRRRPGVTTQRRPTPWSTWGWPPRRS